MEDPASWPTGRLLSTAARLVEHAWAEHLESVGITHADVENDKLVIDTLAGADNAFVDPAVPTLINVDVA